MRFKLVATVVAVLFLGLAAIYCLRQNRGFSKQAYPQGSVEKRTVGPDLTIAPVTSETKEGWKIFQDEITDLNGIRREYKFSYPTTWNVGKVIGGPSSYNVGGRNGGKSVGVTLSISGWNNGSPAWQTSMDYDDLVEKPVGVIRDDPDRILLTKVGNYTVNEYPVLVYLSENKGSYSGDVYSFAIKVADLLYQFDFSSDNKTNIFKEREMISQIVGSFKQTK